MLPLLILGTCGAISTAAAEAAVFGAWTVGLGGGWLAHSMHQKHHETKEKSKDSPSVTEIPGGLILQFSRKKS